MKCLILAAGQRSRLKQKGEIKPIVPLLEVPLIERVIRSAMDGGANEFYVATGFEGEKLGEFLTQLSGRLKVAITTIENRDWQKENGYSVRRSRNHLNEPFFLCTTAIFKASKMPAGSIMIPPFPPVFVFCRKPIMPSPWKPIGSGSRSTMKPPTGKRKQPSRIRFRPELT